MASSPFGVASPVMHSACPGALRAMRSRTHGALAAGIVAVHGEVVAVRVDLAVARRRKRFAREPLTSLRARARGVAAAVDVVGAVARLAGATFVASGEAALVDVVVAVGARHLIAGALRADAAGIERHRALRV